jgi:hypothetical protein
LRRCVWAEEQAEESRRRNETKSKLGVELRCEHMIKTKTILHLKLIVNDVTEADPVERAV